MARAFSDDLRCRILQAYESGEVSLADLARRFGVSRDYVKKIRKHQLRYGQMERVPQARHGPISRVTAEVQQQLRVELRAQPDLTLWELGQRVQQATRVQLSKSRLWLSLQQMGLRLKKSRSTPKSKTRKSGSGGGKRGVSR
jgi:transposase